MACRRGDVKTVQSLISFEKVNINAVDPFDYPPLTLVSAPPPASRPKRTGPGTDGWIACKASLCGHYDVVKLLLENGAICERDTFQGERWSTLPLPPAPPGGS